MTTNAILKYAGGSIEEEVVLRLNGIEVVCFAGICPYKVYPGTEYSVEFTAVVFDDYSVVVSGSPKAGIEQLNNSFAYHFYGILEDGTIDCGIPFRDEILKSDFNHLRGQHVCFKVDRLDVEFLRRPSPP